MKIFVTGGNGFIGSNVVRLLVEDGHDVRCLVRETSDTTRIDEFDWERFVGDVRDAESMSEGADGCDAVIHMASPSSWDDIDSPHMKEIVLDGTRNILAAAEAAGNIPVVHCSSGTAIDGTEEPVVLDEGAEFSLRGEKGMVYATCKHDAEVICEEAYDDGQPVMTVNPGEVYGPFDTSFVTAGNLVDFATSWPVLVSEGGVGVVHVEDVARGTVACLEHGEPGERYILSGDNVSIRQLAEITLDIIDRSAAIVSVPTPVLRGLTSAATTLRLPLPYNPKVIPYATKYWYFDNAKAREELGVEFRSAEETLRPTLDWLREAGHI